jgi:DNA-binding GntR family transcriptional regulator
VSTSRFATPRAAGRLAGAQTYSEVIYDEVYSLIQNLQLQPGSRLVENELSERFGVSKTPIREVLQQLSREHLVEIAPHIGASVTWLSFADYEQQLFILDALESPALELVSQRADSNDFAQWDSLLAAIRGANDAGDRTTYRSAVAALHRSIFDSARYPRLTELIELVQAALYRYGVIFIDSSPREREREWEIVQNRVELLKSREPTKAAELIRAYHTEQYESAAEQVRARRRSVTQFLKEYA